MNTTDATTSPIRTMAVMVKPGNVLVTREGQAPRQVTEVERFTDGGVRFHYADGSADRAISPATRLVFLARD